MVLWQLAFANSLVLPEFSEIVSLLVSQKQVRPYSTKLGSTIQQEVFSNNPHYSHCYPKCPIFLCDKRSQIRAVLQKAITCCGYYLEYLSQPLAFFHIQTSFFAKAPAAVSV